MTIDYGDVEFSDDDLQALLASIDLTDLERILVEEVISLRDDVESKSEIGHAVSNAWREAHDVHAETVEKVREFYRGLMTPKYQWSRHNKAEFSLVVKALGQILGERK